MNFRRSIVRIWIANMCSDFLGVQEANSRVSQQCRIRNMFSERQFENGRATSNAKVGLWSSNSVVFLRQEETSRAEVVSIIHYLFPEMVDHVPRNLPEGPFTSRLHFRGQQCRHSYDRKRTQSHCGRTRHEFSVLTWIGFVNGVPLDNWRTC